jgi:tetratricopeptide (TPR) repeat protein
MVHAAHSSCFHWLQVGSALHQQRAQCLLATVYVRLGYVEAALLHAKKCLELSRVTGSEQTAFDRATVYGSAAKAYALAQQCIRADELWQSALEAAQSLHDVDEHKLFQRLYGRG